MTDRDPGIDWEVAPYPGPPRHPTAPQPTGAQPTGAQPTGVWPAPQWPAPQHPVPPPGGGTYGTPPYGTPPYGTPRWGTPQWGTPYGAPAWGGPPWAPPRRGSRPAPVLAGALVAFAAAFLTLVCTLFLAAFATLLEVVRRPDEMASTTTVVVQLVVVVLLAAGASLALAGRWVWLLPGNAALLVLSVVWLVRGLGNGSGLEPGITGLLPVLFAGAAAASTVLVAWPTLQERRQARATAPAATVDAGA